MHREAEMIEQQLKAKQAGQPGAMPGECSQLFLYFVEIL